MTRAKPLKPLVMKTGKKTPAFETYCLVKKERLWHVMTLTIKDGEVIGKVVSKGDTETIQMRKLVNKIFGGIKSQQVEEVRSLRKAAMA